MPLGRAVAAYTAGPAYQAFEEAAAGHDRRGRPADLCLLAGDISEMGGGEVAEVEVDGTWLAGEAIYRR